MTLLFKTINFLDIAFILDFRLLDLYASEQAYIFMCLNRASVFSGMESNIIAVKTLIGA